MNSYFGDDFIADVEEWWDSNGDYHEGTPGPSDLADAFQVTVKFEYDNGETRYTTMFSGDSPDNAQGWTEAELEAEIEDDEDFYG